MTTEKEERLKLAEQRYQLAQRLASFPGSAPQTRALVASAQKELDAAQAALAEQELSRRQRQRR